MNVKILAAVSGVLALTIAALYFIQMNDGRVSVPPPPPEETAEALPPNIEVVDTPEKRTKGLSGREAVADDYGMLFIFDSAARHGFWMKDMKVAIDIIWISTEGSIVHIEHSLAPSTYPNVFTPPNPARYVLETRAGYAKERGWDIGTELDLSSYE